MKNVFICRLSPKLPPLATHALVISWSKGGCCCHQSCCIQNFKIRLLTVTNLTIWLSIYFSKYPHSKKLWNIISSKTGYEPLENSIWYSYLNTFYPDFSSFWEYWWSKFKHIIPQEIFKVKVKGSETLRCFNQSLEAIICNQSSSKLSVKTRQH